MIEEPTIQQNHLRCYDDSHTLFTRQDRVWYILVLSTASLLLLGARLLQPSPKRVGTHLQLGLPPCIFLHLTGIPCPSCGLTTSVAHAARLHFYESVITQPFGLVVFISAALSIPLSIYFIHRRIPWLKLTGARRSDLAIYLIIALFLLSWLYKIAAMKGLLAYG